MSAKKMQAAVVKAFKKPLEIRRSTWCSTGRSMVMCLRASSSIVERASPTVFNGARFMHPSGRA